MYTNVQIPDQVSGALAEDCVFQARGLLGPQVLQLCVTATLLTLETAIMQPSRSN